MLKLELPSEDRILCSQDEKWLPDLFSSFFISLLISFKSCPLLVPHFQASLVGQSQPKSKGKISRVLANKASLSVRVDALGDDSSTAVGMKGLDFVVNR